MRYIKLITFILFVLCSTQAALAEQISANKNEAVTVRIEHYNAVTGLIISGGTETCKCKSYAAGSSPADLTTNCTNASAEKSSTGVRYLVVTSSENNNDFLDVLCTNNTSNAIPFVITINNRYGATKTTTTGAAVAPAYNLR